MIIYPAIDLYHGKVVRLARGDFRKLTVYSSRPVEVAREWVRQGASWLHVVDLAGAKSGILKNCASLFKIRDAVACRIQFGGGLRKLEDVETVLKAGIDRVVFGTKALDEVFFTKALERFGPKIAVGLDIRNDLVQTHGWLETSSISLPDALARFNPYGVQTIIYTDIRKDGTLEGPDFCRLSEVLAGTRARVILSGGVGTLSDIENCCRVKRENFDGVIVGKALYEKRFTLTEAICLAQIKNHGK